MILQSKDTLHKQTFPSGVDRRQNGAKRWLNGGGLWCYAQKTHIYLLHACGSLCPNNGQCCSLSCCVAPKWPNCQLSINNMRLLSTLCWSVSFTFFILVFFLLVHAWKYLVFWRGSGGGVRGGSLQNINCINSDASKTGRLRFMNVF